MKNILILLLFAVLTGCAAAPQVDTDHPKAAQAFPAKIGDLTYQLEYKLYSPKGSQLAPPLIVMTHGRNGPNPKRNTREIDAYANLLNALADKGYMIMYVIRRGYGNSDGPNVEFKDSAEESGFTAAQDIKAAVEYARDNLSINKEKIVVMGQSQGGWAALAASCSDLPGVVGHVNFNGAINFRDHNGSESRLQTSAEIFGKCAKRPSYWIYAENDNHSVSTVTQWFKTYQASGGKGALFITKAYKNNGHFVHNAPDYYLDALQGFLAEIGVSAGS